MIYIFLEVFSVQIFNGGYNLKKIEILSPAGSFEAMVAAVQNGADAVYLGGSEFSARAFAGNFGREELLKAIEYCHIRGVKVYLTVNTLVKEAEIEKFIDYVEFLYKSDIDALILQDIGMASLVRRHWPDFEIHASTQMSAHSLEDVRLLESMGFSRVVLSRELSIEEITNISRNCSVEIEIFVHGALCICYSGQCLMSSMIGGRSGNRGRCAQPCRREYSLIRADGSKVNAKGSYLMSPQDVCTVDEIARLAESGAVSLKIEGRMKRPEYVAVVTRIYKKALERHAKCESILADGQDIKDLYSIFNRGFTKGYLFGKVNAQIINTLKPSNAGVYLGEVAYYDRQRKKLGINLEDGLSKGDGLSLGVSVGRILKGRIIKDHAYAGESIEIDFIGEAADGERVYKTSNASLLKSAGQSYENGIESVKIQLSARFEAALGEYPKLTLTDSDGNKASAQGSKAAEKALKVSLSQQKVQEQLEKLGNTPYSISDFQMALEEGISMPVSIINEMRREAVEQLNDMRAVRHRGRASRGMLAIYEAGAIGGKGLGKKSPKLRVKVRNAEQLKAILGSTEFKDIDMIYYESIEELADAIEIASAAGARLVCSLPRIMRNWEYSGFKRLMGSGIDDFQTGSLGQLRVACENGMTAHTDYSLNAFNSFSVNVLSGYGAKTVCLSPELRLDEISEIAQRNESDAELEALAYGRVQLMISEYCPVGTLDGSCGESRSKAACKNDSTYLLEDQKGERFPVSKDGSCRSIIYNSKAVCMLDHLEEMYSNGVDVLRIDISLEEPKLAAEIVKAYASTIKNGFRLDAKTLDVYANLKAQGITKGHYYRGVE